MNGLRVLVAACILMLASIISCGSESGSDSSQDKPKYRVKKEVSYNSDGTINYYKILNYGDHSTLYNYEYKEYTEAGTDGIWFTSDDICSSYSTWIRNADGTPIEEHTYTSGTDKIAGTADDVKSSQYKKFTCANGKISKIEDYDGSTLFYIVMYEFSDNDECFRMLGTPGPITSSTIFNQGTGPGDYSTTVKHFKIGNDLTWGTDDDVLVSTATNTYDGKKCIKSETVDTAGVIIYIQTKTKQPDGNYLDKRSYNAGSDGQWLTADDAYEDEYYFYTYDSNDNKVKSVTIDTVDGTICNSDDTISATYTFEYEEY